MDRLYLMTARLAALAAVSALLGQIRLTLYDGVRLILALVCAGVVVDMLAGLATL